MHGYAASMAVLAALGAALLLFKPDRRTTVAWLLAGVLVYGLRFFAGTQ